MTISSAALDIVRMGLDPDIDCSNLEALVVVDLERDFGDDYDLMNVYILEGEFDAHRIRREAIKAASRVYRHDDLRADIAESIGSEYVADFDVDAIAEAIAEYDHARGGFVYTVIGDEFWRVVEDHAIATADEETAA